MYDLQRTKEWYEKRTGRITGSIAGACLYQSKFKTPAQVMRRLVRDFHGEPGETKDNHIFNYGWFCEPLAIEAYEMHTGFKVESCGFFEYEDWLGASPDGLIDAHALGEFKAPWNMREAYINPIFEEILPEYYAQVQIELLCTRRTKCYFVQWCPGGYKIETINIDFNWLDRYMPELKAFYAKFRQELRNLEHLEPLVKKRRGKSAT